MDCRQVQEKLSEYLDGYLIKEDKRKLEKHLKKCPICVKELENTKEAIFALKQLPEVDPPKNFEDELKSKLKQVELLKRKEKVFKFSKWLSLVAAVFLIFMITNGFFGITNSNINQRDDIIDVAEKSKDKGNNIDEEINVAAPDSIVEEIEKVENLQTKDITVRENITERDLEKNKLNEKEKRIPQKNTTKVNSKNKRESTSRYMVAEKEATLVTSITKETNLADVVEENEEDTVNDVAIMSMELDDEVRKNLYTLSFEIVVDNLSEAIDFVKTTIEKYKVGDYHLENKEKESTVYVSLPYDIMGKFISDIDEQYNFDMSQLNIVSESKDKTIVKLELLIEEKN